MPHNCNFIKQTDHQPCTSTVHAEDPHRHCATHERVAARLPPRVPGQCEHIVGGTHWCRYAAWQNDRLCPVHIARRTREMAGVNEEERERERQRLAAIRADLARRLDAARMNALAARAEAFAAAAGWAADPPERPPVPVLQRLAQDRQNVHTAPIARQTNEGEALLLKVATDGRPVGLRILRVFSCRAGRLQDVLRVMADVDHWSRTRTCRTENDNLYARILQGLWALIERQPMEARKELYQRLWEEMSESVGMCCEGHISRLVNVMVGFDDAFKPPISVNEMIQNKMSALSASGAPDAVQQAKTFMDGLAIPLEQQAPWLEALA
jgi:hypothetical protein